MSFPEHPFRHISLVDLEDNGIYYWRCDGCGADGKRQRNPIPYAPAAYPNTMHQLIEQYHRHIEQSHALSREDVRDWSV